jgi:hypothetical protein
VGFNIPQRHQTKNKKPVNKSTTSFHHDIFYHCYLVLDLPDQPAVPDTIITMRLPYVPDPPIALTSEEAKILELFKPDGPPAPSFPSIAPFYTHTQWLTVVTHSLVPFVPALVSMLPFGY